MSDVVKKIDKYLEKHGIQEGWLFKSPKEKAEAAKQKSLEMAYKQYQKSGGKLSFWGWKDKVKDDKLQADIRANDAYKRERNAAARRQRDRDELEAENQKRYKFERDQEAQLKRFCKDSPDHPLCAKFKGSESRLDKYGKAGY